MNETNELLNNSNQNLQNNEQQGVQNASLAVQRQSQLPPHKALLAERQLHEREKATQEKAYEDLLGENVAQQKRLMNLEETVKQLNSRVRMMGAQVSNQTQIIQGQTPYPNNFQGQQFIYSGVPQQNNDGRVFTNLLKESANDTVKKAKEEFEGRYIYWF